ncbi:MAG: PilN domain-containing protein [Thermodesulfobacteriota bacterium]
MIRINLLADHEIRREKNGQWLKRGGLLALSVLLAVILIAYWMLGNQVRQLKKEKETLEQQTGQALALQREIKELKEKKEAYAKRLALLQNLEKDRHGPVRLFEILSTMLPAEQLWLTTLKENGPEIRIDGMALSNEILAEFMKRLEASAFFKQVDLIQSAQGTYKDLKPKQFSISAWTQAPAPLPEPEKK